MDAYMVSQFGGEVWDLCESWVKQKAIPNSQHNSQFIFQDLIVMHIYHTSMFS